MYIVDLNKIHKKDILLAGGKGANLGEMLGVGIQVPPGFCVTSKAYDLYIEYNNIQSKIDEYLKGIYSNEEAQEEYSRRIQRLILQGSIPKVIKEDIIKYYSKLGEDVRVAIRSSATAEDLPEASFAGQQETFLNVYRKEDVIDKVKKCWASLWTTRAIMYRKHTGFHKKEISLAVVIQKMIEGEVSGVLFTVNPSNSNEKEIMINASYGLGESVVSGIVTPDTYICSKSSGKILKKQKGSKEISIVYDKLRGTKTIVNDIEKREAFTLEESHIKELSVLGNKIEKHYGYPQDIEWTLLKDNIYILQARAITTLKKAEAKHEKKQSNVQKKAINNILEHWTMAPYPLDFYALLIIEDEKNRVFDEIGINMKSGISMKDDGEIIIKTPKVGITPKILKVPFILKSFIDMDINKKEIEKGYSIILKELRSVEEKNLAECTNLELVEALQNMMKVSHKIGYIRFRYSVFPGVVIGKFISRKLRKVDKTLTEYDFLSGLKYKTWSINEELQLLAQKGKDNKEIYRCIREGIIEDKSDDGREIVKKLQEKYPKYFKEIIEFLHNNGWKSSMSYLPFSSISWNEDYRGFLSLLKLMMECENDNIFNAYKYEELQEKIIERLGKRKAEKLLKQIEAFRYSHIQREETLYYIEMCYGLSRKIVREISKRIEKVLQCSKDILYLTLDEVYKMCKDIEKNEEVLKERIKIRKKVRNKNIEKWNSYEIQKEYTEGEVLKGISGSSGKVKGKVCIIKETSEFNKLQKGDILVCKFTDPIWTPLFAIAEAVVSDTGGPLSHSAIVAREYNIPAVLGTAQGTTFLKDGDEIIVDGYKGEVIKVK